MEKKNRNILLTLGILMVIVIFCASFIFTIITLSSRKPIVNEDEAVVVSGTYDDLDDNTRIVLKVRDKDGKETEEKQLTFGEFKDKIGNSKTLDALQIYLQKSNYYFNISESTKTTGLVFVRKQFTPGKYYIGVFNNDGKEYLAIYKAASDGKLFIEDKDSDITNFNIDVLEEHEKDIYRKGYGGEIDTQSGNKSGAGFDTKEEAKTVLSAFDIK